MRARPHHRFAIAVAMVAVLAALVAGQHTILPGTADAAPAACTIENTDTSVAGQVTLTIIASGADCIWTAPS
ncbi:MAG TPA: hypothetical protein VJQ83_10145, partial [Tepidiformaceae bacterium]|nr:hypothetical protein [Tepidiformaceae bacterium]